MANKKEHLTKVENDVTEVGIQLRDTEPVVPKDNRVYINKSTGEMKARFNGVDRVLNITVRGDDVLNPVNNQMWINASTKELKYKYNDIVTSIALSDRENKSNTLQSNQYLAILDESELSTFATMSANYPTFVVDAFNDERGIMINAEVKSSSLKIVGGESEGTYSIERKISQGTNAVEGALIARSQALAPESVANSGNETTAVFKSDVTKFLKVGTKFHHYLEDRKQDDYTFSNIFTLDSDFMPIEFELLSFNYDAPSNKTTAVFSNTSNIDLTLGEADVFLKTRFIAKNHSVFATSNSLTSTLTELIAENIESLSGVAPLKGDERLDFLKVGFDESVTETNSASKEMHRERILMYRVSHSPNKQFWLIQIMVAGESTGDGVGASPIIKNFYSHDGLQTITRDDNFYDRISRLETYGGNAPYSAPSDILNGFSSITMEISDDGRFVYVFDAYTVANVASTALRYGIISPTGTIVKRVTSGAEYGLMQNGGTEKVGALAVDWDYNVIAVVVSASSDDELVYCYSIDWNTVEVTPKGILTNGSDYLRYGSRAVIAFFKDFEGERKLFILGTHLNYNLYSHKISVATILSVTGSQTTVRAGLLVGSFSNSVIDGNISDTANFGVSAFGGNCYIVDYLFDQNDRLIVLISDHAQVDTILAIVDFGRTRAGEHHELTLDFSNVPISGSFTLDVQDVAGATISTTSPLAYSASASQIQTALEAITSIGAGNVDVVGAYATGLEITIKKNRPFAVSINTNTLSDGIGSIIITNTLVNEGKQPIWLRLVDALKTVNTPFVPADGLIFKMLEGGLITTTYRGMFRSINAEYNNAHVRGHIMKQNSDGSIIITAPIQQNVGVTGVTEAMVIKIPDYTKLNYDSFRYFSASTGTAGNVVIRHTVPVGYDINHGKKLYQKFTTPSLASGGLNYPDGKIPVRTVMVYAMQSYATASNIRGFYPLHVKARIVSVGAGDLPDTSTVRGTNYKSKTSVKLGHYGSNRYACFVFDNLKLDPSTDYYLELTIENPFDSDFALTDAETKAKYAEFLISFYTSANASSPLYSADEEGNLRLITSKAMLVKFMDFYYAPITDNYADKITPQHHMTFSHYNTLGVHREQYNVGISKVDTDKYIGTVAVGAPYNTGATFSEVDGGMTLFKYKVDDTLGSEFFPRFSEEEVFGHDEKFHGVYDKNLMVSHIFGTSDPSTLRRSANGTVVRNTTNQKSFTYNSTPIFGGGYFINNDSVNIFYHQDVTGLAYGTIEDSKFRYGVCLQLGGERISYIPQTANAINPYYKDFAIELEYETVPADLDNTWNIIFARSNGFHFGFNDNQKIRLQLNHFDGQVIYLETVQQAEVGYRRYRITKNFKDGLRLFYNLSKEGGVWVEYDLQPDSVNGNSGIDQSFTKNGYALGNEDYNTGICFGGYYENTSYDSYGKIGYFKMVVGSDTFAYEGINVNQKSFFGALNFGEIGFAYRGFNNGSALATTTALSDVVVVNHKEESTSLVKTPANLYSFGARAIVAGQKPSVKIELSKNVDDDTTCVLGYALNFLRK